MDAERKPRSLLELCVRTTIDNLQRIDSLDGMDTPLLRRILPHCTMEQLTRIESRTAKDLTPVTDILWKGFYRRQFGEENTTGVVDRMRRSGARYNWKDLFRAKTQQMKEVEDKMVEALTNKCRARNAERQSKGTKPCTKVPPGSCKRSYFGGPSSVSGSGYKNPMLKKARMEVDNRAKMQAAALGRKSSRPTSHGRQPMRTTAIRRPNLTTAIAKPTDVNRSNQNDNRSRF